MLSIKNISKSYGAHTLFSNVNFILNPGDRLAIVGPNGCGKTTLMRILAGKEKPDHGSVVLSPPNHTIGYLPQDGNSPSGEIESGGTTGSRQTISQYLSPTGRDQAGLEKELELLATEISRRPDCQETEKAYAAALEELQELFGVLARQPGILAALGLDQTPANLTVDRLSGGQQTRLALARILLVQPQILMLDEPTNHLDLEMLDWLEKWLITSPCAVLYVSHDRRFLERTATGVLEMNPFEGKVRQHALNYGQYLELVETERQEQLRIFGDQQIEIARLQKAVRSLRATATFSKGGKTDDRDKFAIGFFTNRSLGTVGRAKSIENKIEKIKREGVGKPRRELGLKIEFEHTDARPRDVLELRGVSIGYGKNKLISDIDRVLRFGSRTALIGSNGTGKSTLLKAINGEIQPLSGIIRLSAGIKMGLLNQIPAMNGDGGHPLSEIQAAANWNETDARAFLSYYLFQGDSVYTPLAALSCGERSRLELAKLVATGCNLLLLDEPLNHLDISARQKMEDALLSFPGTVLFVVHDRVFIERVATEIWEIKEGCLVKTM